MEHRLRLRCAPGLLLSLSLGGAAQAQIAVATPISAEVEAGHARLLASPLLKQVLAGLQADDARALADLKVLTEIPAPPFKERARAEAFLALLRAHGLPEAAMDGEGNVIGLRKGSGEGPLLVVSAHLDTVFPEGTDVTVKERDGRLYAPGISDDTRGLAVLISWLEVLNKNQVQTVGDLMFVGDVGEEELGNLRGMKALFRDHPQIDGLVGLEPGEGNGVITVGTGSHRYEVLFHGPGGHSFMAFGLPSAIHAMGRAIAKIGDVRTPSEPKTTFTVGTVSGGTSVNTIAGEARMAVDIRSNAMPMLLEAEEKIMVAVAAGAAEENQRWDSDKISVQTRLIGDRPAGNTPARSIIVQAALRSIAASGKTPLLMSASTDANLPMSLGIPAIILGSGGKTGGFHARDEWFDPRGAWEGAQTALTTVLALVGVQGISEPMLARRTPRP